MKRYKVCIKNAKECQIELNFPDLCVKYTNGFCPALKIREGQEIPLDVCDPDDIRKSWLVGSLKGYLDNKWIEEIKEDALPPVPVILNPLQFISEQQIIAPIVVPPQVITPIQPVLPVAVVEQKIVTPVSEAVTDLTMVTSYDIFTTLTHFLKLRFIKETTNIALLNEIVDKTTSAQIRNNIKLRFSK